jgi:hypothetical protein
VSGAAFAGLLLALGWARPRFAPARFGFALLASVFALAAGLAGLVLGAFWGLTEHWATWRNPHLLLLSPLALLSIPTWLGAARRAWRPGSFQRGLVATSALFALLSGLCLADPAIGMPLLPWMALLIPVQGALAITLWHTHRRAVRSKVETS